MIVVADASPLIFLAKIRRLALVPAVLGSDIRVPRAVREEVLTPRTDSAEADVLADFLAICRVENVTNVRRFASAMSAADNEALTLAVRRRADILLCDDRIVRLMAETEGVQPLGTLGLLLRAMRQTRLTPAETRKAVDALVRSHGFRIDTALYLAVVRTIEGRD